MPSSMSSWCWPKRQNDLAWKGETMRVVEIRDLDGPNIFLLEPAIKLEIDVEDDDESVIIERVQSLINSHEDKAGPALIAAIDALHERAGLDAPTALLAPLEVKNHFAVAFGWSHRQAARLIAETIGALLSGQTVDLEP